MSVKSLLRKFRRPPNDQSQIVAGSELFNDDRVISKILQKNLDFLTNALGNAPDLIARKIKIGNHPVAVVYLEGMVKMEVINHLLHNLMVESNLLFDEEESVFSYIKDRTLTAGQVKEIQTYGELLQGIVFGDTLVLFSGINRALVVSNKSWNSRGVEESSNESVIRGPKDSFNEDIMTNLALIRRRIRDPRLRVYQTVLGERTKTPVFVIYLEDVANPEIFEEILARFSKVEIDGILESGVLEELIEDDIYSPFPQILYSERPDKAAAHILEGRYVILVDSTPIGLIVPAVFAQFVNSPEDYYGRWIMASFIRFLRYAAIFSSMFLPGVYVALTSYHYQLIPSRLTILVAEARTQVPFSPIMEALLMEITLELLREAGLRLPPPIGQTIGVVGGILIGNAAVQAGLASPMMVIVVSLTAISTFIIPNYNLGLAVRFVRFPIMLLSALYGGYGLICGWFFVTIHLMSLESFGVPYFAPYSPLFPSDLKDSILRFPTGAMIKRPTSARAQDMRRQVPKSEN